MADKLKPEERLAYGARKVYNANTGKRVLRKKTSSTGKAQGTTDRQKRVEAASKKRAASSGESLATIMARRKKSPGVPGKKRPGPTKPPKVGRRPKTLPKPRRPSNKKRSPTKRY